MTFCISHRSVARDCQLHKLNPPTTTSQSKAEQCNLALSALISTLSESAAPRGSVVGEGTRSSLRAVPRLLQWPERAPDPSSVFIFRPQKRCPMIVCPMTFLHDRGHHHPQSYFKVHPKVNSCVRRLGASSRLGFDDLHSSTFFAAFNTHLCLRVKVCTRQTFHFCGCLATVSAPLPPSEAGVRAESRLPRAPKVRRCQNVQDAGPAHGARGAQAKGRYIKRRTASNRNSRRPSRSTGARQARGNGVTRDGPFSVPVQRTFYNDPGTPWAHGQLGHGRQQPPR